MLDRHRLKSVPLRYHLLVGLLDCLVVGIIPFGLLLSEHVQLDCTCGRDTVTELIHLVLLTLIQKIEALDNDFRLGEDLLIFYGFLEVRVGALRGCERVLN